MRSPKSTRPPAAATSPRAKCFRAEGDRGLEGQRGAAAAEGTPVARAERQGTCTVHAHRSNYADGRFPRAERTDESTERSDESRRAEDAHRKVVCKQQTKADRLLIAAVLADILRRYEISTDRLSAIVDINEKQIRKMLTADVSIPAHMARRLPTEMKRDYLAGYAVAIGCESTTSPGPALDHIRRTRDVAAAQELEDMARDLAREMQRER